MKHMDHANYAHLRRAFWIHIFLDVERELELFEGFDWRSTPELAKRLRAFTNSWISVIGSCAFGIGTFCLVACLLACNLKQFGQVCLAPPQKWQNHWGWGLFCFLATGWIDYLGFVWLKSILILLVARIYSLWTLSIGLGADIEEDMTN